MTDDEGRRRTALHEAAHAVMAHLLGRTVDIISIKPGEHYRGVTIHGADGPALDEVDGIFASRHGDSLLARYGLRPPFFDIDLLRRVSSAIMISLAGHEAELLLGAPFSGFREDEYDQERAERLARVLTEPTAEEMKFLEDSEREESPSDEERAQSAAQALVRPDPHGTLEAVAFVHYQRYATQRIVVSDLFTKPCLTLAEQLDEHTTVGSEAFLELFEEFQHSEELVLAAEHRQMEEGTMALLTKKKEITEATRVGELVVCDRGIVWSTAGSCREGAIVLADDPRVAAAPEAFRPLIERLDG
jgi:hypothetical protein